MSRVKFSARNLRRLVMFLFKLSIVLLTSLTFLGAVTSKYIHTPYNYKGFYLIYAFYTFLFVVLALPYDIFKIGIMSKRKLQLSYLVSIVMVNIVAYAVLSLISKALINPLPVLVLTLVQFLVIFVVYEIANMVYFKIYPSRETLIIYADTEYDRMVAKKFVLNRDRYKVRNVIKESAGFDEITKSIDKYDTVIIGNIALDLRDDLIDYSYARDKRIFVLPTVNDIILHSSHVVQVGDSIMHLIKDRTMSLESLIVKRLFDIFFSVLFLLLTLPLTVIVALIIKLYDRGPIFFKQKRLTRNCEEFDILKFRSMIVDAEKDGAQFTVPNDDRITPIGKFIRATRIDEIPQFINVLKGEMSIVGPRAERVENYEAYTKELPEFNYRTKVKAGITGYAQIYGRYNTSYEDKLRMDIYYIENFSLLNDIKLILSTVKVLFSAEATEGFEQKFLDEDEHDLEK